MLIKVEASKGVPVGAYEAEFIGVERMQAPDPKTSKLEDVFRWPWCVVSGEYAGTVVGKMTAARLTLGNNTGKIVAGIMGKPLSADSEFDPAKYAGKRYSLWVEASKSGATYVGSCALKV